MERAYTIIADLHTHTLASTHAYSSLTEMVRAASERGGAIADLFNIPVREKIGRAKSVPAGEYREAYAAMDREMEEELEAAAQKGESAL